MLIQINNWRSHFSSDQKARSFYNSQICFTYRFLMKRNRLEFKILKISDSSKKSHISLKLSCTVYIPSSWNFCTQIVYYGPFNFIRKFEEKTHNNFSAPHTAWAHAPWLKLLEFQMIIINNISTLRVEFRNFDKNQTKICWPFGFARSLDLSYCYFYLNVKLKLWWFISILAKTMAWHTVT